MYLYALGIYQYDPITGEIKLKKISQKETLNPDIPNQLYDLETKLLPKSALSLEPNRLYYNNDIIECQFIQRLVKTNIILAVVSRDIIIDSNDREKNKENLVLMLMILNNMTNIYLKQSRYGFTLKDLLYNPLLKEDIIVDKINKTNEEVKDVMLENIKLLIDRGENLDDLLEKTNHLKENMIKLEDGAKKLNTCCRW